MQCILTALKAESKPLIDYFRLSKSKSFDFPVFENEALDLSLIGLGVGKTKIEPRIKEFMNSIEYT